MRAEVWRVLSEQRCACAVGGDGTGAGGQGHRWLNWGHRWVTMELDFRSESPLHFSQIAARTPPRSKLAAGLQNARPKRLFEQLSVSVIVIVAPTAVAYRRSLLARAPASPLASAAPYLEHEAVQQRKKDVARDQQRHCSVSIERRAVSRRHGLRRVVAPAKQSVRAALATGAAGERLRQRFGLRMDCVGFSAGESHQLAARLRRRSQVRVADEPPAWESTPLPGQRSQRLSPWPSAGRR